MGNTGSYTMSASTVANFAPAASSCEKENNSAFMGAVSTASFLFLIVSVLLNLNIVCIGSALIITVILNTLNRESDKFI